MLKTVVIGKTVNGATQASHLMVISGDRIVLVDATTGQPPKKVTTKMVNKDLHIFAEGASEPSVILNDYASFEHTIHISGIDPSGAYVNYGTTEAGSMELGAVSTAVVESSPIMSTSAWWGVGILAAAGGVAAAAGGGGGGDSTTTVPTVVIDPLAPTVTSITMSDVLLNKTETAIVTIVFSEAVAGFSNADVIAPNGTLSTLMSSDNITWTATFTPTDNIIDSSNTISITAGSYTNSATTLVGAGATSANYAIDTQTAPPPPLTIAIIDDQVDVANISGTSVIYTFTFSEAVTGFSASDITVLHGTKGTLITSSTSVYSMAITPDAGFEGEMTVDVAAGVATSIGGNLNVAAFQSVQAVDMVAPTVTSIILADPVLTIGETSAVTITFSEAVTNFDNNDVTLTGAKGTLSALGSANGGQTWTGLFTPTALTSDASNIIQVLNTYTDMAGNGGTLGASNNFTIDTRVAPIAAPTLTLTTDTAGVSATDGITYTNGMTVGGIIGSNTWEYSLNGGTSWTTGSGTTFNLVANTSYAAGQIQVRQIDTSSNVSSIATNTQTTIVDTVVAIPTINTIATNDVVDNAENANLIVSGTGEIGATVTLAVTGQTDVVDSTGAWSITVLDTATSFSEGAELLSVTQTDVAGNVSVAGTHSIFIDTLPPTFTNAVANIGSDTIALTFSETMEQVNITSKSNFILEINGTTYYNDAQHTIIAGVATVGNTVTLVLDPSIHNINFGDVIRINYADTTGDNAPAIQDSAGNDATSFGNVTASISNTDTPPVITNMVAHSGPDTVVLTFNEALNTGIPNLPSLLDFSVDINGTTIANAVNTISILGQDVTLTMNPAALFSTSDLVKVTYTDNVSTTNAIQDLVGNDALSFSYTNTAVI